MIEWDYNIIKVDKYDNQDLLAELKKAGIDGWELIQIISYPTGSLDLAIMKRSSEIRSFKWKTIKIESGFQSFLNIRCILFINSKHYCFQSEDLIMKNPGTSLLISEIQLLLAEKRTSLATLRTGIAVFVLPISVLTILVSTSKFYNVWDVQYFILPLIGICIFLIVLAIYLIARSISKIRAFDAKIGKIQKMDKEIEKLMSK